MRLKMSRYYEDTRELARRLTLWSKSLEGTDRRFVVCSGGGPESWRPRTAAPPRRKGENIGLNISLPFEQQDNPYITRRLAFEFHYFFMRKFWFSYLAKAMVVMPGGFGTFDEFMEVVTLVQTLKIKKHLPIVLFGTEYWSEILNFEPMVKYGTISPEDVNLFFRTDSVDEAFDYLVKDLETHALKKPNVGTCPTTSRSSGGVAYCASSYGGRLTVRAGAVQSIGLVRRRGSRRRNQTTVQPSTLV
jgi:uncharacterized protein (TIGR00730 family)